MDQHKYETPMCIPALMSLYIPFNQFLDVLAILVGSGMLYVKKIMPQISITKDRKEKILNVLLQITETIFFTHISFTFVNKTFH
jgi:hypothetical protein